MNWKKLLCNQQKSALFKADSAALKNWVFSADQSWTSVVEIFSGNMQRWIRTEAALVSYNYSWIRSDQRWIPLRYTTRVSILLYFWGLATLLWFNFIPKSSNQYHMFNSWFRRIFFWTISQASLGFYHWILMLELVWEPDLLESSQFSVLFIFFVNGKPLKHSNFSINFGECL